MNAYKTGRSARVAVVTVVLSLVTAGVVAVPAFAENATGWEVESRGVPATNMVPGSTGEIEIAAYEIGAKPSEAGATVTDHLPAGIEGIEEEERWTCDGGSPESCTLALPELYAGQRKEIALPVRVSAGASEGAAQNVVTISGGGAATAVSTSDMLQIGSGPESFGFAHARAWFSLADGEFATQAGTHPYAFTFSFDLNEEKYKPADGEMRNLTLNLPPGIIGDPNAIPRCTREQFNEEECPGGTQIGVDDTTLGDGLNFDFPVYNLVPPPGSPAQFGFFISGIKVFLDASVRSDGNYGITEHVNNIPQRQIVANAITVWGVPADPSHDVQRECSGGRLCVSSAPDVPFLTVPTSCATKEPFTLGVNSWFDENVKSAVGFELLSKSGEPQVF